MAVRSRTRSIVIIILLAGLVAFAVQVGFPRRPLLRIGSKAFTESVVLGEIVTLLAQPHGEVDHRRGLGGTQVAWGALRTGEIDAYVEYAGTIRKEILPRRDLPTLQSIQEALDEFGVRASRPLGFNNTYAIGMRRDIAARLQLRSISDLRQRPELSLGFTNEFLDRADGWPGLRTRYQLPQTRVRGMEHALAYSSLESGAIDATDLYSTDAKIRVYDLQVLEDDRHYFPNYDALLLYRSRLETAMPGVVKSWHRLEGRISEADMQAMNSRAEIDKTPERTVAADFLTQTGLVSTDQVQVSSSPGPSRYLLQLGLQHVTLVVLSLGAAILIALPLGILAASRPGLGQALLAATGIVQTIPSIALLVFMIPLLGIGSPPAIAALFVYSLLPIVRNTYAGLRSISVPIRESAEALGLPAGARLRLIELPMSAPTILAGIKTAAIINVGTATLGGFIGAGGFGEVIFTGLYKADNVLILEGAIPTAALALAVQGIFEIADRYLVPRGLRIRR